MTQPTLVLKTGGLDGRPPQEVLVVQVVLVQIEVPVPWSIQTVDDGGVPRIRVDNIGTRMGVPSLVGTRDGNLVDTVDGLGNSRHGDSRRSEELLRSG